MDLPLCPPKTEGVDEVGGSACGCPLDGVGGGGMDVGWPILVPGGGGGMIGPDPSESGSLKN